MSTTKDLEAALKRVDKIERTTANNGRVVATKSTPQKAKKKESKKVAKSVLTSQASARGVALPHDCVKEWAQAVADPWGVIGVKIPYNPLSVPTTLSTTARVFNTSSITVPANTTQQIVMFPGHLDWNGANPLDLVAAHSLLVSLRINGVDVTFSPSPVNYGGSTAVQGAFTTSAGSSAGSLTLGTYNFNSSGGSAVNQNIMTPAIALPFTGSSGDSFHTRYRLVSMGLVVTNTTAELNISGSIVSVQPDAAPLGGFAATGNQSTFETYPSFKRYPPNKQVKLSWIPRGEDLMWNHVSGSAATVLFNRIGMAVWLNGGSAEQTYQIDWVANYEIAGNNTRSIATDAINFPKAREIIEPAMTATHLTDSSATKMVPMVHITAANNAPTTAPAGSSISDQVSEHAKSLAMHATKLVGQAAAPVLKALGNHAAARLLGERMGGPYYPGRNYAPRALTN